MIWCKTMDCNNNKHLFFVIFFTVALIDTLCLLSLDEVDLQVSL